MKRLPFLTSAQRRALLVVEWVLLIGIVGFSIWKTKTLSNSPLKGENPSEGSAQKASPLRGGLEGSLLRGGLEGSLLRGGWVGSGDFGESLPEEQSVETFPFDPNTADSTTLLRLGLSPWQVRNIYRYRAKHGRYHTPEDFMRLRGLTNEQWERLKPYIRIDKKFQYVTPVTSRQPLQPPSNSPKGERTQAKRSIEEGRDTTRIHPSKDSDKESPSSPGEGLGRGLKLSPGQTIDINTADTTQLKLIPGIASKRAARIVAYRQSLGGFVSVEQAMEAIEMPDSVLRYMTVTPVELAKINVNRLSVQQMMKHPYLSFYQAKAIFEHRRNKGELHSIEELSRLDSFKPSDIDRLRPYIEF